MLLNSIKMNYRSLFLFILFLPAASHPFTGSYPADSSNIIMPLQSEDVPSHLNGPGAGSSSFSKIAGDSTAHSEKDSLNLPGPGNVTTGIRVNEEYLPKWYEMFTNIPNDYVRYYKQEFTTERLPFYLGMAVLTAGLIISDQDSWKASDRIYKSGTFVKNWSDIFTEIGDGRTQFALAGAFGALGFITQDRRALRTASQIVEAVLASGAAVQVLKHITGRESPFLASIDGGAWRFFPNQIEYAKHTANYDAYPSGHICTSMAAFIVIAENYPEYKWIRPAGYTLAGLIGIGMANKGIHWYSDYPLGIALGYLFGELIAHPEIASVSSNMENKEKMSFNLYPYYNLTGTGVTLSLKF